MTALPRPARQGARSRGPSARARLGTAAPATLAALAALLAGAAALRVVGARYGLPLPLLNPDEESIVPRAWAIGHGERFDPGWYDYPSLVFYLHAPLQALVQEPSYGLARALSVALGVAGVAAAWWLGRRAYGPRAAWVAGGGTAVATVHVAYSRMAVTDVPLTLGVTLALALAVAGRLEWAGVAAGLAASAKYPGVFLAVPLLVAGWGRWRRLAAAGLAATAAFVLTSPFVVLHAGAALDDFRRVQRLARAGWLGFEEGPPAAVAFLDRLWESLGPFALLAAAGLVLALVRRRRADLVLASFAVVYYAELLTLGAHFDRYVLPLVPPLAALAGALPRLAALAPVLLVVPLAWSIGDARGLTREDAREHAYAWLDQRLPAGTRLAADPSLPVPPDLRVTRLELAGPGLPSDPDRDLARLRRHGVRYVAVTGAIADRVLSARERYRHEAAFYDGLERRARRLLYVPPPPGSPSPWAAVYDLGPFRAGGRPRPASLP